MDSFEVMQEYMKREISKKPSNSSFTKEEKDARALVAKVNSAKGSNLREKAESVGVDYQDFMNAQRLIGKRY